MVKAYDGMNKEVDINPIAQEFDAPEAMSGSSMKEIGAGQLAMIIADNRVLKQLERQLKDVRLNETARGAI